MRLLFEILSYLLSVKKDAIYPAVAGWVSNRCCSCAPEIVVSPNMRHATGTFPVPEGRVLSYHWFLQNKFGCAGLTPLPSVKTASPGIKECPVVMEADFAGKHDMFKEQDFYGAMVALEVRILTARIHPELSAGRSRNSRCYRQVEADDYNVLRVVRTQI